MGSPQPRRHRFSLHEVGLPPSHSIATAAALRLRRHITCYYHSRCLGLALRHSFKNFFHLSPVLGLKDIWHERTIQFQFKVNNLLHLSTGVISSACLCFFNGDETSKKSKETTEASSNISRNNPFSSRRKWTNILLAVNIGVYITGIATQWRLLQWGAKINPLIAKGQVWRLVTSAFLHANVVHLMVNCYSLDSVGPLMERSLGPGKFLAVYFASAIAGSTMSYGFCKSPTVGASGAIFGLVGSFAVLVLRHREMFGDEYLQRLASVLGINVAIGLLVKHIDNWGHLGGWLGGTAVSWLVGPAWKYEGLSSDGHKIYVDRAPLSYFREPNRARCRSDFN